MRAHKSLCVILFVAIFVAAWCYSSAQAKEHGARTAKTGPRPKSSTVARSMDVPMLWRQAKGTIVANDCEPGIADIRAVPNDVFAEIVGKPPYLEVRGVVPAGYRPSVDLADGRLAVTLTQSVGECSGGSTARISIDLRHNPTVATYTYDDQIDCHEGQKGSPVHCTTTVRIPWRAEPAATRETNEYLYWDWTEQGGHDGELALLAHYCTETTSEIVSMVHEAARRSGVTFADLSLDLSTAAGQGEFDVRLSCRELLRGLLRFAPDADAMNRAAWKMYSLLPRERYRRQRWCPWVGAFSWCWPGAGAEIAPPKEEHCTEATYKHALAIEEKMDDCFFYVPAKTLDLLGNCYLTHKRYGDAERAFKKGLAMWEAHRPSDADAEHLQLLLDLAALYLRQGKDADAQRSRQKSLDILKVGNPEQYEKSPLRSCKPSDLRAWIRQIEEQYRGSNRHGQ